MSISEKQLKANQENAQKSTGPKTVEGKKIVSQNAVRHGLNAVNIILNSPKLKEDQSEYDLLVAALKMELEPQDTLQFHLVYKIANCHWRYRRLINAETAQINKQIHPEGFAHQTSDYLRNLLESKGLLEHFLNSGLIPKDDEAHLLSRYEYRLSRELANSYKLLRQLQSHENREIKKSQNKPISPPPLRFGEGPGEGFDAVFSNGTDKKSQNKHISPKPNPPQQPAAPAPPTEHIDSVFNAIQNDQSLPPDPMKITPVAGLISALELKQAMS